MKKKNESFSLAKVLGMDNWLNRGFQAKYFRETINEKILIKL